MKIQLGADTGSYSFVASTKTVTLRIPGETITLDEVLAIIHAPTGQLLYAASTPALLPASFTPALNGSAFVLNASISNAGMTDADPLTVIINSDFYPGYDTVNDNIAVGNTRGRFRDPFTSKDPAKWTYPTESGSQYARSRIDGTVAGESYLVVSLSALVAGGDEWVAITKDAISDFRFTAPFEIEYGMSISQRMQGQEINIETVGVSTDGANTVFADAADTAKTITQAVVASNVATITTSAAHNLLPGDWIVISGFADSRLNVGPVIVTAKNSATSFNVSITIANATYTAGTPVVRRIYICGLAQYMAGIRWYGTTAGNCDTLSRNNDPRPRMVNFNPGNTQDTATIPSEGVNYSGLNYAQYFRTRGSWHQELTTKRVMWRARDIDSTTTDRSQHIRRVPVPSHDKQYQIRIRAKNLPNLIVPTAPITAAVKATATTTATLTVPSHGLTTSDYVVVYGIRDQTNYANATTAVAVSSVVDANTITVVVGAAAIATSYGGFVMRVQGSAAVPTINSGAIQTYAKTADGLRLSLVGSANWGFIIGDTVTVYGLVNSTNTQQTALYGRYRMAYQSTTTCELEPLDGQDLTAVSTTPANAGGNLIRNTDLRLHYMRAYDRTRVEVDHATGGSSTEPIPCNVTNMPTTNVNLLANGTAVSVGTGPTVANATLRVIPASEAMNGIVNVSEAPILSNITF